MSARRTPLAVLTPSAAAAATGTPRAHDRFDDAESNIVENRHPQLRLLFQSPRFAHALLGSADKARSPVPSSSPLTSLATPPSATPRAPMFISSAVKDFYDQSASDSDEPADHVNDNGSERALLPSIIEELNDSLGSSITDGSESFDETVEIDSSDEFDTTSSLDETNDYTHTHPPSEQAQPSFNDNDNGEKKQSYHNESIVDIDTPRESSFVGQPATPPRAATQSQLSHTAASTPPSLPRRSYGGHHESEPSTLSLLACLDRLLVDSISVVLRDGQHPQSATLAEKVHDLTQLLAVRNAELQQLREQLQLQEQREQLLAEQQRHAIAQQELLAIQRENERLIDSCRQKDSLIDEERQKLAIERKKITEEHSFQRSVMAEKLSLEQNRSEILQASIADNASQIASIKAHYENEINEWKNELQSLTVSRASLIKAMDEMQEAQEVQSNDSHEMITKLTAKVQSLKHENQRLLQTQHQSIDREKQLLVAEHETQSALKDKEIVELKVSLQQSEQQQRNLEDRIELLTMELALHQQQQQSTMPAMIDNEELLRSMNQRMEGWETDTVTVSSASTSFLLSADTLASMELEWQRQLDEFKASFIAEHNQKLQSLEDERQSWRAMEEARKQREQAEQLLKSQDLSSTDDASTPQRLDGLRLARVECMSVGVNTDESVSAVIDNDDSPVPSSSPSPLALAFSRSAPVSSAVTSLTLHAELDTLQSQITSARAELAEVESERDHLQQEWKRQQKSLNRESIALLLDIERNTEKLKSLQFSINHRSRHSSSNDDDSESGVSEELRVELHQWKQQVRTSEQRSALLADQLHESRAHCQQLESQLAALASTDGANRSNGACECKGNKLVLNRLSSQLSAIRVQNSHLTRRVRELQRELATEITERETEAARRQADKQSYHIRLLSLQKAMDTTPTYARPSPSLRTATNSPSSTSSSLTLSMSSVGSSLSSECVDSDDSDHPLPRFAARRLPSVVDTARVARLVAQQSRTYR